MKKLLISLVPLFFSMQVWSMNPLSQNTLASFQWMAINTGLNLNKGDFTDHKLNMGFIAGSNHTFVRSVEKDGVWIVQDMDLGFLGKQKAEILLDPNTGEIKKFIVNGKEEQIPENDSEIISAEEAKVTVPAGTFDAIYLKVKDNKSGDISQMWINPEAVPVFGSVKSISPSQMGDVVMELSGFGRGNE